MRVPLEETMPNNCSAAAKPSRATVEIAKRILCKVSPLQLRTYNSAMDKAFS